MTGSHLKGYIGIPTGFKVLAFRSLPSQGNWTHSSSPGYPVCETRLSERVQGLVKTRSLTLVGVNISVSYASPLHTSCVRSILRRTDPWPSGVHKSERRLCPELRLRRRLCTGEHAIATRLLAANYRVRRSAGQATGGAFHP